MTKHNNWIFQENKVTKAEAREQELRGNEEFQRQQVYLKKFLKEMMERKKQ